MTFRSLSARLILLACLSISVALGSIAFVLGGQFSRYFEDRVYSELAAHLDQLTANLAFDDLGNIVVEPLLDPRFEAPFSGLYWQALREGFPRVVSRSLWTGRIEAPLPTSAGVLERAAFVSSLGEPLLALSRAVAIGEGGNASLVTLTIAIDQSEVQRAAAGFQATMFSWMLLISVGLIAASWVQVKLGLAPLETLRQMVERVRSGEKHRLEGRFPSEVQPLADEVNELLDLHDVTVAQARERASNLAHGLKTPLTIINTLTRDLRKTGQGAAADEIDSQIASMSHFIERELARVRIRTPGTTDSLVFPVAEKMLASIKRFPRETPLEWLLDIPDNFTSPFDAHDLSELFGNLLDNARKWARSKIRLSAGTTEDGRRFLRVEDDGAGVSEAEMAMLGTRGQRLDPAAQGSGLGLAICADLAAHYGAKMEIGSSGLGGLAITTSWPPAP